MTALGIHMVDALIGLAGGGGDGAELAPGHPDPDRRHHRHAAPLRLRRGRHAGHLAGDGENSRIQVYGTKGTAEMRGETQLVVTPVGGKPEIRDYPPTNKERAEVEFFADLVAGRGTFPVTDADAINGVSVLEQVERSARAAAWLDVP